MGGVCLCWCVAVYGVKWYNIRRFMREKTQENSGMGYSAAYPTGAERCLVSKPRNTRKITEESVRLVSKDTKNSEC